MKSKNLRLFKQLLLWEEIFSSEEEMIEYLLETFIVGCKSQKVLEIARKAGCLKEEELI